MALRHGEDIFHCLHLGDQFFWGNQVEPDTLQQGGCKWQSFLLLEIYPSNDGEEHVQLTGSNNVVLHEETRHLLSWYITEVLCVCVISRKLSQKKL